MIIDDIGILMYYTMITVFTLRWFEAYQTLQIHEELIYEKTIINMKTMFWILNTIQYTTYITYMFLFYDRDVMPVIIVVFCLTFFPDPIILGYYGYKLLDILEFLTNITKRKRDIIRVKRLKIIRNALVGFGIYRIIIWGY